MTSASQRLESIINVLTPRYSKSPEPALFLTKIGDYCLASLSLLFLLMWLLPVAPASETVIEPASTGKVHVNISGVKGEQLSNVQGYLEIYSFNGKAAPSPARLRYLHRSAVDQIKRALQPFAYYKTQVESDLKQTSSGWQARYTITKGPAIKVKQLDLRVSGAAEQDPEFQKALAETTLKEGQHLDQQAYEKLKKRFQALASERGYFDAKLKQHEVRIHLPSDSATITLHLSSGDRYKLGEVAFNEEKPWISPRLLHRFNDILPGQPYDAGDLQRLQGDLSSADYYKQVEINADPKTATGLIIPIEVQLKPRNPRKYILGAGYGTDTGARVKAGITGRRVNHRGHHYTSEILISQIRYGIAGKYIIPAGDPRTDAYGLRASYEDEHSDTRNYQAYNIGGYFKYRDNLWIKTYALDYRVERFELTNESPTSTLLIPSVNWTRTFPPELEKRVHPDKGAWLQLRLRGGHDALLSDTTFLQPLASAKWIRGFDNRSRIIGRLAIGSTYVDDFSKLPTSLRYFTGGDRTIRGHKYNVIGPSDNENAVVGGKNLNEASLEYEYPIKEKWSIAAFVDYGDAFDNKPDYKTGVGLGLRWISPIGPVRIDLGHGIKQPPGSRLRLHLTIGPDL